MRVAPFGRVRVITKCSTVRPEFHVAPMRDYTDAHQRHFTRLLTKEARLWSEMEKSGTILNAHAGSHKKLRKLLKRGHPERGYEVFQLGGNDPGEVSAACAIAAGFGYDEINLNCGCPAVETGGGDFGASLMRDGGTNAAAVIEAMVRELDGRGTGGVSGSSQGPRGHPKSIPVTVKCRIGICETADDVLSAGATAEAVDELLGDPLRRFIKNCKNAGAEGFTIHARQAVMCGVTPKNNRGVPPLRHDLVTRIADEFFAEDGTPVTLNGGVGSIADSLAIIDSTTSLAGVQAGRWCLFKPFDLLDIDAGFYGHGNLNGGLRTSEFAIDAIEQYAFRYAAPLLASGKENGYTVGEMLRPLLLALCDLDDRINFGDGRDTESAVVETREYLLECVGELLGRSQGSYGTLKDPKKVRKALKKAVGNKVVGKQRGTRAEAAAANGGVA